MYINRQRIGSVYPLLTVFFRAVGRYMVCI